MTLALARPRLAAALAAASLFAAGSAAAAEPYVATGFPFVLVGVAQPINASGRPVPTSAAVSCTRSPCDSPRSVEAASSDA